MQFLLWSSVIALLISACAPPPTARRAWDSANGIKSLWPLLEREWAGLDNLTTEASVEFELDGVRDRATALIQVKGDDLFRMEVRGPLYSHIFTAVQQGDSLTVWGSAIGGAWKGAARGSLLRQLTGVDFGQYPLARALLGWVEPAPTGGALQVEYERADRAVATVTDGPRRRRLWVDLYRGVFLREEIRDAPGRLPVTRTISDYVAVGSLFLPQRVKIAQGDVHITVVYQSYDLKRVLNAAQFESGIPEERLLRVDY